MPQFDDDTMIEIGRARERLEAYVGKIQPYSPYLETEATSPIVEPEWTRRQWDSVTQLQSEVRGWREKHAEALLAIDNLAKKVKLYEGGDLT